MESWIVVYTLNAMSRYFAGGFNRWTEDENKSYQFSDRKDAVDVAKRFYPFATVERYYK